MALISTVNYSNARNQREDLARRAAAEQRHRHSVPLAVAYEPGLDDFSHTFRTITDDPSIRISIEFKKSGQFLRVNDCPLDLETLLRRPVIRPVMKRGQGVTLDTSETVRLAWRKEIRPDGTQNFLTCPGFFPDICRLFEHIGLDTSNWCFEPPPVRVVRPGGNPFWAELLRTHHRGLVRYDPRRVDPVELIYDALESCPKDPVLVVATHTAEARRVLKLLQARYFVSWSIGGRQSGDFHGVHVATSMAVQRMKIWGDRTLIFHLNPDRQAVALPDDGVHGFHPRQNFFNDTWGSLFGFLPTTASVTEFQQTWLRGWFGDAVVTIPAIDRVSAPPRVAVVRVPGIPGATKANPSDSLLVGIHDCRERTRLVARVARFAAGQDTGDATIPASVVVALADRPRGRVAVLTDHVGHAVDLVRSLGWPLISDVPDAVRANYDPKGTILGRAPTDPASLPYVITLPGGMAAAGRFDVVIRADGGLGLPAVNKNQWLAPVGRSSDPPVLIDFDDRHRPDLRRRAKRRRDAYRATGWD